MRDANTVNSGNDGSGIRLKKGDLILPHVLGVDEVIERYTDALRAYIEEVNRPVPDKEFRKYLMAVDPDLLGQVDLIVLLEAHDEEILQARGQQPRKRGRPKGSKNKPKTEIAAMAVTAAEAEASTATAAVETSDTSASAAMDGTQLAASVSKPFCMTREANDDGYQPCCPNGHWLARLDRRIVSAQGNVFLYFTECTSGSKWRLKAYAARGFRPLKGTVNVLTDIAVGEEMLVWSGRGTTGTPQLLDVKPVMTGTTGSAADLPPCPSGSGRRATRKVGISLLGLGTLTR